MRSSKAVAVFAVLAMVAAASAVSAQSYGFNHAGALVVARGLLRYNLGTPGAVATTCRIEAYGVVAMDGESILIEEYNGEQVLGDFGNLACSDLVQLPITVTVSNAEEINLDRLDVATRAGPCQEINYRLKYTGNMAVFSGDFFGGLCSAMGNLSLLTVLGGDGVSIVVIP